MADVELIIKIPKDYYNYIKNISDYHCTADMLIIKNGIPLPEGHGRLIDADAISPDDIGFFSISDHQKMVHKLTTSCQTIIESDKEQK